MRIAALLCLLLPLALRAQVWEPLNGPLAVEVREVEVNSSDILFFITSQGLQRSLDNGDTWELLDNGLPTSGLADLLVAPNNHVFVFGPGFLLYRSVDDGVSWAILDAFLGATCLEANAQGTLFMAFNGGVNRSFDDGDTWASTPGPPGAQMDFITAGLGDTLFTGFNVPLISGGAFRSVDAGVTWSSINFGQGLSPTHCIGVNSIGHVFAGTEQGMTGLMRSTDGGSTWTQIEIALVWRITSIAFNSSNHVFISSDICGLLRSIDNGNTWTALNTGLGAQYTGELTVNSADHVFAASSLDLYRSTDGGLNWSGTNNSIVNANVRSIHVNDDNDYFAAVSGGLIHRSIDAGGSWQTCNAGLFGSLVTDIGPGLNGHLFVSTIGGQLSGGVFGSLDNGSTWNMLTDTTGSGAYGLTMNSNGDVYAASQFPYGIMRSTNGGATWLSVYGGLWPCYEFDNLVVGGNDVVFAAGRYCGERVFSTSWGVQSIGTGEALAAMAALSARDDGTVLAALDGVSGARVFRAENNIPSWQQAAYGLPDTTINVLLCHPTPGLSLAGTPIGVYITNNDGDDWWPFSDGLTNMNVTAFAIDQNGYVLAGTAGGGVFRAALPVGLVERPTTTYALEQNVPNPSSSSTSIAYSLRAAADVTLSVHDVQGRLIAEVVNTRSAPGRHTVEVSTAALAQGIYTYSLSVDGVRSTKRMAVEH